MTPTTMVQNTAVQSKRKLPLLGTIVATYAVAAAAVVYGNKQVRCIITSQLVRRTAG
jgi:hypothetical protein